MARNRHSKMEPGATVVDKLKDFAKSTQNFTHGLLSRRHNSVRRSAIEILKRLQREAFADIMKLRDRLEKVERMLTFHKSSKGSSFQEAGTHVRGKVDVLGGIFIMDGVDIHKYDAVQRSGIRTGIDARFTFETAIREKDLFVAEFKASEKGQGDLSGGPLSLTKVFYEAHFSDWFSAVAIPVGGKCRDVGVALSSLRERYLDDYCDFEPPLLNQRSDKVIGITMRKPNVVASFAQFVSGLGTQVHSAGPAISLGNFGQVVWQVSRSTKVSLLGMQRNSKPSSQKISLGALALPISMFQQSRNSETVEEDTPTSQEGNLSDGSIALMFNSELDENMRIGGWIETKNSYPKHFQWTVTMADTPEDEHGWGLSFGGSLQGPKSWDRFQVDTFLNLNLGKRFKVQPAMMYVMDGSTQFCALTLRSSWSL